MLHKNRGFTLIEVLVTLTILSFVGIAIWNVFFQGSRYSQTASSKNEMVQEGNIIMMNLTNIHQTSDSYTIASSNSNCGITVTYTKATTQQTQVFSDSKLCYSFSLINNFTGSINPKLIDVPITLTINDKQNPNNKISIDSTLYRLKGGN